MNAKKSSEPKPAQKKGAPGPPKRADVAPKPRGVKPVTPARSNAPEPKITLYRHTTAPKFGDPQLDRIASDITHGIAKRRGEIVVSVSTLTNALRGSKNVKWRNATANEWCNAVLSFLLKSLAHRTKLLTFRAEGSTILFKAIWRMPSQ